MIFRITNQSQCKSVFEGFAIGRTIESVTKGLWIWVRKHPEKDGVKLVLIDTEGLGDAKKVSPLFLSTIKIRFIFSSTTHNTYCVR